MSSRSILKRKIGQGEARTPRLLPGVYIYIYISVGQLLSLFFIRVVFPSHLVWVYVCVFCMSC